MADRQNRRFCFTIHQNPTWLYDNYTYLPDNIKFIIFQLEAAPDTGKEHLQGYAELKHPTKLSTFQNYFKPCGKFHVEAAKGSQQDNIKYCSKEESRIRETIKHGTPTEQGRRSDLEGVAKAVLDGATLEDIARDNPACFVRNCKGLQALHAFANKPTKRPEPTIKYLWGKPGCGKSYLVRAMVEMEHGEDVYWCNEHAQGWFDGYEGQSVVVFDDFTGKFPLNEMLKVLDYGPLNMWVKGSRVALKAHTFYFTSNFPPEHIYLGIDHQPAWLNRITGDRYQDVEVWDEEQVKELFKDINPRASKKPKRSLAASADALRAHSPDALRAQDDTQIIE